MNIPPHFIIITEKLPETFFLFNNDDIMARRERPWGKIAETPFSGSPLANNSVKGKMSKRPRGACILAYRGSRRKRPFGSGQMLYDRGQDHCPRVDIVGVESRGRQIWGSLSCAIWPLRKVFRTRIEGEGVRCIMRTRKRILQSRFECYICK
jgi:hypothetical protein